MICHLCGRFDGGASHCIRCGTPVSGAAPALQISAEELAGSGLPLFGFQPLELPRYTVLDAGACLRPAVEKKLESGQPFSQMHALYVRKSQAEEGRR